MLVAAVVGGRCHVPPIVSEILVGPNFAVVVRIDREFLRLNSGVGEKSTTLGIPRNHLLIQQLMHSQWSLMSLSLIQYVLWSR